MENPIKVDDLKVPYFRNPPFSIFLDLLFYLKSARAWFNPFSAPFFVAGGKS